MTSDSVVALNPKVPRDVQLIIGARIDICSYERLAGKILVKLIVFYRSVGQ